MARPLRIQYPGAFYHVMARGNERRPIFRDDLDRSVYLKRLAHYREKFDFRLLAYCLMPNHVHLAIETGRAPLSRIMAGLQTSYTQYFNLHHRRVGHLFQGRYKALVVDKDAYFLALLRYIHENPVESGLAQDAAEFPWSSDRYYRRGKAPEWFDLDRGLSLLGGRRTAAIRNYRVLMATREAEPYEAVRTWTQTIKGDEDFAQEVLSEAGEPAPAIPGLTVEAVARAVAAERGIRPASFMGPGRGRAESRSRLLAALLARDLGAIPVAQTAHYFGRDTSTFSRGIERLLAEADANPKLRGEINALAQKLRGRRARNQ
jgi:REP-associated tyrosine transposase